MRLSALYLQGQTPFDLADESIIEHLEELQKKQNIVSDICIFLP